MPHIAIDQPESCVVGLSAGHVGYPAEPPFSPGMSRPEYPFDIRNLAKEANHAYEGVRESLHLLNLDAEHYGQKDWNPLGAMIGPGHTVVLKPNCIRDFRATQAGHEDCLITHGSIVRAVLDYVYIALRGEGRVIIADAPQNDADFDQIRRILGLDEIQEFYHRRAHLDVEVYDLRPEKAQKVNGVIVGHASLAGDPAGYVKVDLGRQSAFCEISHWCHLLYGAEYDTAELRAHHHDDVHEYLISRTILDADCVINLPKLKTHKKTGITVSMKNLVGINGNKNWLPHHREGTPAQGGDQFADDGLRHRIERTVMTGFRHLFPLLGPVRGAVARPLEFLGRRVFGDTNRGTIRSGNWYGNDTTWRMVTDLNRILLYADGGGRVMGHPVRHILCIVDGIIGGEGNGPLDPTPKRAGVVLAGENPVAVDLVAARLMGFDYRRLPMLAHALRSDLVPPMATFKYHEIACKSNVLSFDRPLDELECVDPAFRPHFGWRGHIELDSASAF